MNRFVLCLFLSVACTKKNSIDSQFDPKETFRTNLTAEPQSLDWSIVADSVANEVLHNITEGLVRYDLYDPNLKLLPALALSWESKSGGRVWEFQLRQGVKWTDGTPLTPQHFLDGYERSLNPSTASQYASVLFPIKSAREYSQGKIKDFKQVGVKVIGNTLRFELLRATAFFPSILTLPVAFPIRKDVIEKHGSKWTDPQNIQTLGPYRMKSWEHDKLIVLERNEGYYGTPAKTKNVLLHIVSENASALNLFEGHRMDFIHAFPMSEYERLKKTTEFRTRPTPTLYFYGFNLKQKPFDDVRVRQAIAHAIDRDMIVASLGNGELPIKNWIPEGFLGHNKTVGLGKDIEKAKKLLEDAGIKPGTRISLAFYTSEVAQKIGENVQAQLKKNLGLDVDLQQKEWKVYLDQLPQIQNPIFYEGWLADYLDPDSYMYLMTSDSENNYTHWKSAKYDGLVAKAASELDSIKRVKLYDEAQKLLLEDEAVVVPLIVYSRNTMVSDRVRNVPLNIMETYRYDKVEVVR